MMGDQSDPLGYFVAAVVSVIICISITIWFCFFVDDKMFYDNITFLYFFLFFDIISIIWVPFAYKDMKKCEKEFKHVM